MKALVKCGKQNYRRFLNVDDQNKQINIQQLKPEKEYKTISVKKYNELLDFYENKGYENILYLSSIK